MISTYCDVCGGLHVQNHTLGRLRHAATVTRHATPINFASRLRMLWRDFVIHGLFGPAGEICQDCGRDYVLWHADDDLWLEVVGCYGGLLCPACFDRRSAGKEIMLRWIPTVFGHHARAEGEGRE